MASKRKSSPQAFPRNLILFGLIAIVAVVLFALSTSLSPVSSAPQMIDPAQYQSQFSGVSHLLLDVRTLEEFASGRIDGATNISVETLPNRLNEVPRDVPIVVYCRSGNRSAVAVQILADAGYTHVYDLGGIIRWQAQGLPVVE
jgi:rhodanese-related sulfurtransferase